MPSSEITISNSDWLQQSLLDSFVCRTDREKMDFVISLSRLNAIAHKSGEPFASVVFDIGTNRLIAVGVSQVVPGCNSAKHGEIMAVMLGQDAFKIIDFRTPELNTRCFLPATPARCVLGLFMGVGSDVWYVVW